MERIRKTNQLLYYKNHLQVFLRRTGPKMETYDYIKRHNWEYGWWWTSVWNGHLLKHPRLLNILDPMKYEVFKIVPMFEKERSQQRKRFKSLMLDIEMVRENSDFPVCCARTETVKKADNSAFRSVLTIPRGNYQGSIDKETRGSIWHHNCNFEAYRKKRLLWRWNATNRSKTFKAGWNKILPILL